MKTKKFNKTLTLNKTTIANLGDGEMNRIQGGVSTDFQSCDSYCASICPVKCPPTPFTVETWCICYTIDYGC